MVQYCYIIRCRYLTVLLYTVYTVLLLMRGFHFVLCASACVQLPRLFSQQILRCAHPIQCHSDNDASSIWLPVRWYTRFRSWRREEQALRVSEVSRLKEIYYSAQEGHCLDSNEMLIVRAVGGSRADQYGEITPKGFSQLGLRMQLNGNDNFVDLGSGTGKVVLQAMSEFRVLSAVGVELARSRHEVAVSGLLDLVDRSGPQNM